MKTKWLTGLLALVGVLAVSIEARAQFGAGYQYNPYSTLPPGFYRGFYYGVPGSPFVQFRGTYTGPGNTTLPNPGGGTINVNQQFRDTPFGTASRAGGGYTDTGVPYTGLLSPATRSVGARVGAGAFAQRQAAGNAVGMRREIREFRVDEEDGQAQIKVVLPAEDAKVWFEDTLTEQRGAERVFVTPSLERGTTYSARVTASWKENGQEVKQERKVEVRVGRDVVVDFTVPDVAADVRPQRKEKEIPPPQ